MSSKKTRSIALPSMLILIFAISFSDSVGAQTVRISIATGGTGGVYYPVGGAMARLISKYVPNTEATAEVTSASVDNLKLLHKKGVALAMFQGDTGYDALKGADKFKAIGPVRVRCICSMYSYPTQFVALKGSGINSVSDFRGRRVATGAPGSGTEVISERILESYGIDIKKDIKRERLSAVESANALKDGKIEAFTWISGVPNSAILDLASTPGIKIKILDTSEHIDKLIKKYGPVYPKMVMPKGTYPNVDYDVHAVGVTGLLGCHEEMDAGLVYNILKTILEHQTELAMAHKEVSDFNVNKATTSSPIPFHPGAIKYFRERGIEVK